MKTDRHVSALRLFWTNCRVLFHNDALSWWRLADLLFGSIPMGHSWRTEYVACNLGSALWSERKHGQGETGSTQVHLLRYGNHREVIAAMDFFTVPTFKFGALLFLRHWPPPPTCAAFQRHAASHQYMDRATVSRGVSLAIRSPVSHLRSGCQEWVGGPNRGSLDGYPSDSNFVPESLAEWDCGAVG